MSKSKKPRVVHYRARDVLVKNVTLGEMTLVVEATTTTGIPVQVSFDGVCLNVFRDLGLALHEALRLRAGVFEANRRWFEWTQEKAKAALTGGTDD